MNNNVIGRYRDENDPLRYAFSVTIRNFRHKSGLSQNDVAKLAKINRSTFSYYETYSAIPPMATVFKLCEIFEISVQDFMSEVQKNRNSKERELGKNA